MTHDDSSGVTKQDAARDTPIANGRGARTRWAATPVATGSSTSAAAWFDIGAESTIVSTITATSTPRPRAARRTATPARGAGGPAPRATHLHGGPERHHRADEQDDAPVDAKRDAPVGAAGRDHEQHRTQPGGGGTILAAPIARTPANIAAVIAALRVRAGWYSTLPSSVSVARAHPLARAAQEQHVCTFSDQASGSVDTECAPKSLCRSCMRMRRRATDRTTGLVVRNTRRFTARAENSWPHFGWTREARAKTRPSSRGSRRQ
jgi:hypothetical protein